MLEKAPFFNFLVRYFFLPNYENFTPSLGRLIFMLKGYVIPSSKFV